MGQHCSDGLLVPGAENLVEQKWSETEALAKDSVNLAKQALADIAASANEGMGLANFDQFNFSPNAAGSVDVEFNTPDAPDLPDLAYPGELTGIHARIGIDNLVSVTWRGVGVAPKFQARSLGAISGLSVDMPTELGEFSEVYTAPNSIDDFTLPPTPVFNATYHASSDVGVKDIAAPAAFNEVAPQLNPRSEPVFDVAKPGEIPDVRLPSYPSFGGLSLPVDPQQFAIPLPSIREPDLSGIDALLEDLRSRRPVEPVWTLPEDGFLDQFNALHQQLSPELTPVLPIEEVLTWMLSGESTGLSANVAQMLRDRAFSAEDQLAWQAETTAIADWLSRGFTLPGGALEAKLSTIRQGNRDKKAQLNRDLWAEEAKLEIENLRAAIQYGIQYQSELWNSRMKLWGLCGELAGRFLDVQIKVLEATLTAYKARVDAWQAEASVVKELIQAELQAELGKLEITKSETEIARLYGDLNKNEVEVYKSKVEASIAKINVFRAQVDAANGQLQGESLRIEAFGKQVQAYSASVQAYEAEWRGYAAAVSADVANIDAFKAQVQAYATQADVYGKLVEADRTRVNAEISVHQLKLEEYKTKASVFNATTEAYKALVGAEQARSSAKIEAAKLPLEAYKARAQVYSSMADAYGKRVQAASSKIQAEVEIAKLPVEVYKAEAQAYAAETDGYAKAVEGAKAETAALVSIEQLKLSALTAELESYKAELQRASLEIEARAKVHDSQVRLFSVNVTAEQARVEAALKNIDQALRVNEFETSIGLKQAELEQTRILELAKLAVSSQSEVARVASQLAGSALSAVNASATIGNSYSASRSASSSCSEEYKYDMSG